jgi:hypothetical protein
MVLISERAFRKDRPFSFLIIKVDLWLIHHGCAYVAFM